MSDLEETKPDGLRPYERGIESGEVVKATLGRFMPASLLSLLGSVIGMAVLSGSTIPSEIIFVPMMAVPLVAGFGVGLEALRRFLYPDANLSGRRSVIAGILSPFAFFSVMVFLEQFGGAFLGLVAMVVIGVVLAVSMFFAWLTPTPADMLPPGWSTGDTD
jgi:hypothetical protein